MTEGATEGTIGTTEGMSVKSDGGGESNISEGMLDKVRTGSSDGANEMDGRYVGESEGTYEGIFDDVGTEDKLGVLENEVDGIIEDLLEGFADEINDG